MILINILAINFQANGKSLGVVHGFGVKMWGILTAWNALESQHFTMIFDEFPRKS